MNRADVGDVVTGKGNAASAREAIAAKALLDRLAWRPRPAGSATEAQARSICADKLRAQGFHVTEEAFTYSALPGRWAPSVAALVLAVLAVGTAYAAIGLSSPELALGILLFGLVIVGAVGWWTARYGTRRLPWLRSSSVNLVATRGEGTPQSSPMVWLVAHIDSKSQTVPMQARIASVAATGVAFLSLALALIVSVLAPDQPVRSPADGRLLQSLFESPIHLWIAIVAGLSVVAVIPMMLCIVRDKSRGALDNASGVAAVLLSVRNIDAERPIGVLITSGEELGLAGARAFADGHAARGVALNCDTVDDRGRFLCMKKGSRSRSLLVAALERAAAREGAPMLVRGMLPGVLADNVAFTDAGWDSLTLSRGNIATLGLVHTEGDLPDGLDGSGIAAAARLLAATIEELQ